jgi:hypothetical protein
MRFDLSLYKQFEVFLIGSCSELTRMLATYHSVNMRFSWENEIRVVLYLLMEQFCALLHVSAFIMLGWKGFELTKPIRALNECCMRQSCI